MTETIPLSQDDRNAITDVLHQFFWLVDHGRANETPALFTADARITFGPGTPKPGTIEGATIKATMEARATHTHVTTRHVMSNIVLKPLGDGTVAVTSLLTLYRSDDETRGTIVASVADIDETYVRESGGWRIRARTVMPIFNRV